jgi:hypothetical protein
MPGPRGLLRVGIVSASQTPEVLNFIAIEPVSFGPGSRSSRQAFSELEASQLDPGLSGKRLTLVSEDIRTLPAKPKPIEQLTVRIEVEPFAANYTHVYLIASMQDDRPSELRLSVFQHEDSAPVEELAVTATMGNYERLRLLWLKGRIVDSRTLYSDYNGDGFVEREEYFLPDLLRTIGGGAIALCTASESDPSLAANPRAAEHWHYRLPKLTQYWRVEGHDLEPDLRVRVNGRRVYWRSHDALPGGIAFENFELRQRYRPGQTFIFGFTADEPSRMPGISGISSDQSQGNR